MELNTGSAISTLPLETYKETFPNTPLIDTTAILKTYSWEEITPEGKLLVRVEYNNQVKDLTLHVVKTQGPALFGRDWLHKIQLDWKRICPISKEQPDFIWFYAAEECYPQFLQPSQLKMFGGSSFNWLPFNHMW